MENVNTTIASRRQQLPSSPSETWTSPVAEQKTRQMIFLTVLTDYIHATLKCPGSCCRYYIVSNFLTQGKDWKWVCTTFTDVNWSVSEPSHDLRRRQLMNVMWQELKFGDADWCYFTKTPLSHKPGGKSFFFFTMKLSFYPKTSEWASCLHRSCSLPFSCRKISNLSRIALYWYAHVAK